MLDKIARAIIIFGHLLLLIAAILLIVGHSPDSFGTNYPAETLADYAYAFFWLGFVGLILGRVVRIKPKK